MKNKIIAGLVAFAVAMAMIPGLSMLTKDTAYAASYSITNVTTSVKKISGGKVKMTCTATYKCSSTANIKQEIFAGSEISPGFKSWKATKKSQKRTLTMTKTKADYNKYFAGRKAQFFMSKGSSVKASRTAKAWKKL